MRPRTDYIVVHCSATRTGQDIGAADIDRWHRDRGWSRIGYHFVIRLDGAVEAGRELDAVGAHCKGHNRVSVGVCLVGGLSLDGGSAMTFTPAQLDSLRVLLSRLKNHYPTAQVLGHRDLSPDVDGDGVVERHEWMKDCPCMDVRHWLAHGEALFHVQAPPPARSPDLEPDPPGSMG